MQCNKNPEFSFNEGDQTKPHVINPEEMYHLLLTFRTLIPQEKRFEETKRIVQVSVRDFAQYKNPETQKVIGWTELEILHDPTAPYETDSQKALRVDAEKKAEVKVPKVHDPPVKEVETPAKAQGPEAKAEESKEVEQTEGKPPQAHKPKRTVKQK